MGRNMDLDEMLGLPKKVICPKCGMETSEGFSDYDIDEEDVNPEPGVWNLWCGCEHCDHEWKEHFRLITIQGADVSQASDGYHTFEELYDHRHALFALLCVVGRHELRPWKSKLHSDGTMFDGWFIAGLEFGTEQITYHFPAQMWGNVDAQVMERAPAWDGHTPNEVVKRLLAWAWDLGGMV